MNIPYELYKTFTFSFFLSFINLISSSSEESPLPIPFSYQQLSEILNEKLISNYQHQLMYFNIFQTSESEVSNCNSSKDLLEHFPSPRYIDGGISISNSIIFQSVTKFERNAKAFGSHSKVVIISIALSTTSLFNLEQLNFYLTTELNQLRSPIVYRDMDTFLIILRSHQTPPDSSSTCSSFHTISKIPFISKLRDCKILSDCDSSDTSTIISLDPQRFSNFNSQLLRVSTTWRIRAYIEFHSIQGHDIKIKRGLYGQVLNFLSMKLNFTYELFIASGNATTGKKFPNGTWTGTIGDILYGDADLGFPVGVTASRYEAVDLPCVFTHEVITFISGPPVRIFSWKSLFWPFSLELWAGMALALIASIIGMYFLQYLIEHALNQKSSSLGFIEIFSYFITTFIEQESQLPKTLPMPTKVHLTFWLFFALVGSTAYKSKMVGFLTFPVLQFPPRDFEELADSNDYTLHYQMVGGVGYNLFRSSTVPLYAKIFKRMSVENNSAKCFDRVLFKEKHICVVMINVINDVTRRNYTNRYGKHPFIISPSVSFTFSAGIATEIRAPFSFNIKTVVDSTYEMGIISHWYKRDLHELQDNRIKWEQSGKNISKASDKYERFMDDSLARHTELNLNHLKGPIALLGLGASISSFVFIFEKCMHL